MYEGITIGLDLSDKDCQVCVLDASGEVCEESRIKLTPRQVKGYFRGREAARAVLEVGTHSLWVARTLEELGHEVIVANPRRVKLISNNERKSDKVDAELLARLGRVDVKLLAPIRHRSKDAQAALSVLRARDGVVEIRTKAINQVRAVVKTTGRRLPKCSSKSFHKHRESLPEELKPALEPLMKLIEEMTQTLREYDKRIEEMAEKEYPETRALRQVPGVGPVTALVFVLTLDDPSRFASSRKVGAYLGLCPRRGQSGGSDPQLRISKTGDPHLRRLLVNCANYILGPLAPESDLRRWGQSLAERGGKNAKKRAIVAVARKLASLLHALWVSGEEYQPLRSCASQKRVA